MYTDRIERDLDFACRACAAHRRVTLTGISHGRSQAQAAAGARAGVKEVEVFLRCPACGARPIGPIVRHLIRTMWGAVPVVGLVGVAPVAGLLLDRDDPFGPTLAIGYAAFWGLILVAGTALVVYNVRRAQKTQVRWH